MCRAVALLCSLAASKALAPPRRLQKLTEQLPIMEHPTESVYALEGRGTRADPKKVSENVKKCHLSRTIYANDAHGSGDRAELVALAQVLYKKFRYPTLYEVPQSIAWWDTRLQRPTLSSVLEMFQQATKTKLNYFRRMFCEEKRRSKQHLAEHLRRKNPSDARQEIKPLVLSLVKKLDKGSCEIAAKTWDEFLESRVNGLEAIIEAAQQTADGYKYLDPESTNLINYGEFDVFQGGSSLCSGRNLALDVAAHANGYPSVEELLKSGRFGIVTADLFKEQEGGVEHTTLKCDVRDLTKDNPTDRYYIPGRKRDETKRRAFLDVLGQRLGTLEDVPLGSSVVLHADSSPSCTPFFNFAAAVDNRLPVQLYNIIKDLKSDGYEGYDMINSQKDYEELHFEDQEYIASLVRDDYVESDNHREMMSLHAACVAVYQDKTVCRMYGAGRRGGFVPYFEEMSQRMLAHLESQGAIPKGMVQVKVGSRRFIRDERMLPGMELLPRNAVQTKRDVGLPSKRKRPPKDGKPKKKSKSMVPCGELAQIVEAPVHQVRLLMGITDAVLTKRLAEYYTRRANPPRGTKPGPYPPWDNLMLGDNFVPARLAKLS